MHSDSMSGIGHGIEGPRPSPSARAATLDAWCRVPWADGLQIDHLPALQSVYVQTRNTRYEITIVNGSTGDILVSGGRFFPVPTEARLNGCTLGGSCLKWRGLYPGFKMELQIDGDRIITTTIQTVALVTTPPANIH